MRLNLESLTPMQLGRVNAALDKRARYAGEVRTLREHIALIEGDKTEGDGIIDWNRTTFNRMNGADQRAYEARLKARRYYYAAGWQVPKIVWDCIDAPARVLA